MYTPATIQIDASPSNIAEMKRGGMFHSHQDGRWRFTPNGPELTVFVNDPTEQFPVKETFSNGIAGAACPDLALFAHIHGDGTRGMRCFERDTQLVLNHMYSPRSNGEREFREWLLSVMHRDHVAEGGLAA